MEITLSIILFIVGTTLVLLGADWLTKGASDVAKRFNVSTMIIGLTVVAFGTSMPELVVSTLASTEGKSEIAIGNVVGSNIFNTLAIAGATALFCPIFCQKETLKTDLPTNIIATILLCLFASPYFFCSSL